MSGLATLLRKELMEQWRTARLPIVATVFLLVGLLGNLWMVLPLWLLWLILVIACLLSAAFMFAIMKKLERASNV